MLCDETDGVVYAQTVDILGERHIHVNVDNLVDISAVCVQILRNIYDSQVWAQEQLLIIPVRASSANTRLYNFLFMTFSILMD